MSRYSVSAAARKIGVTRSTLLYYERLGLVAPQRHPENRYRRYSEDDIQRLITLRQLQKAGLSLNECRQWLEGHLESAILHQRLDDLKGRIDSLNQAHTVLAALLRRHTNENHPIDQKNGQLTPWHVDFETRSPQAHAAWLNRQGFTEKETLQIRWVSRDMDNHNDYMEKFLTVFEAMKRQGPGSAAATRRSFEKIDPHFPMRHLLEVGCGKGVTALLLAQETGARVTALDNHQPFLDHLNTEARRLGLTGQITTVTASMAEMPFEKHSCDVIWCEGAAYFIGVENAMKAWRPLLREGGYLFISDAVWTGVPRSKECTAYWQQEYPDMTDMKTRSAQARAAGYTVVDTSLLPQKDWLDFYADMETAMAAAEKRLGAHKVFEDMKQEIQMGRRNLDAYGYGCILLRKA